MMSEHLPPWASPGSEPAAEEDEIVFEDAPCPIKWRRWVVLGLVVAGGLAVGAIVMMIYVGAIAWQRKIHRLTYGLAPATAPGQGPFRQVAEIRTTDYVQGIGSGDVDGDGRCEGVVWAGNQVEIYDRTGVQSGAFRVKLSLAKPLPVPGVGSVVAGGGIRRPLIGRLRGRPAIVLTDGTGESVLAFGADGGLLLDNRVRNTHVRCLAVADIDGDGGSELLVGRSSAVGLICLDSAGNTRWKHGATTGPSWICVGDGNGDHTPEIFVGYDAGPTHILNPAGQRIGEWSQWALVSDAQCADLNRDGRAELLLVRSVAPSTSSARAPSVSGTDGAAPTWLYPDLCSVGPDGTEMWQTSFAAGLPSVAVRLHLAHGDLDGDSAPEWISSAPDGTVRVYDIAGNEIGSHAFGQQVQALCVVGGAQPREKGQVWASLGKKIVVVEWR